MKNQLHALGRSFSCAWRGLWRGILTQRNLRIHLAASCWAVWLGKALELSPARLAVLLVTCGMVVVAELLNTAVEALTDYLIPHRSETARIAKDTAAGAVLAAAGFALLVGAVLLWQPDRLMTLILGLASSPLALGGLAAAAILSLWFIFDFGTQKRRSHD